MRKFACVLFEVDAADPHILYASLCFDPEVSICGERLVILRDLISFWQIGIEIILAGENAFGVNLTAERQPNTDRQLNGLPVQHRKRAWLPRTNGTDIPV